MGRIAWCNMFKFYKSGESFMKKSYLLSGMIVLGAVAGLNAMQQEQRPMAYQMLDSLQPGMFVFNINWQAIFKILDEMQGVINVNEYRSTSSSSRPTLLYKAVNARNLLVAKTLLEKYKANPNIFGTSYQAGGRDEFPLTFAIQNNDLAMVGLLLKHGADPSLKDKRGISSLDYAKEYKTKPEILELLEENIMSRRSSAAAA